LQLGDSDLHLPVRQVEFPGKIVEKKIQLTVWSVVRDGFFLWLHVLLRMTFKLLGVHHSYSLLKGQVRKLVFFHPDGIKYDRS